MRTTWLLIGALALVGCTTHADGTQSVNKTAVGAGIGAVAGGLLGNRLDKDKRGRGTIIGALGGAAAGAGLGYMMDRQEADLREQLATERQQAAIEIERVREDLLKLTLSQDVTFDFDSAQIKPTFEPSLQKVADVLSRYPDNRITVVGHTDSLGAEVYNQQLSERRAEAVRDSLAGMGVSRGQLSAIGRGELEPRAPNESAGGRAQNRRVEILLQSTT